MRVKICGVTTAEDVRAVAAAGADAVGVVAGVDVDTPREVTPDRAADLVAAAPPLCSTVLVTTRGAADAAGLADRVGADHVQVHGLDGPGAVETAADRTAARVIAAVGADEPALARRLAPPADALLVDTPAPGGGGGTGQTHDWTATRELAREIDAPVILAGGLDPDNVARAVRTVEPYGVDVASGVERAAGLKRHDAVRAFVTAARGVGGAS